MNLLDVLLAICAYIVMLVVIVGFITFSQGVTQQASIAEDMMQVVDAARKWAIENTDKIATTDDILTISVSDRNAQYNLSKYIPGHSGRNRWGQKYVVQAKRIVLNNTENVSGSGNNGNNEFNPTEDEIKEYIKKSRANSNFTDAYIQNYVNTQYATNRAAWVSLMQKEWEKEHPSDDSDLTDNDEDTTPNYGAVVFVHTTGNARGKEKGIVAGTSAFLMTKNKVNVDGAYTSVGYFYEHDENQRYHFRNQSGLDPSEMGFSQPEGTQLVAMATILNASVLIEENEAGSPDQDEYMFRASEDGHPEHNQMEAELDMGDKAVLDAMAVSFREHTFDEIQGDVEEFCRTRGSSDVFTFKNGEMYRCSKGAVKIIQDSGDSIVIKDIAMVHGEEFVKKPKCSSLANLHPEIFVTPVAMAKRKEKTPSISAYQAYARDEGDSWQIKIRMMTIPDKTNPENDVWTNGNAELQDVIVARVIIACRTR